MISGKNFIPSFNICAAFICDEIYVAWKIAVVITYLSNLLYHDVWPKCQMFKELINMILFCETTHKQWLWFNSFESSAVSCVGRSESNATCSTFKRRPSILDNAILKVIQCIAKASNNCYQVFRGEIYMFKDYKWIAI